MYDLRTDCVNVEICNTIHFTLANEFLYQTFLGNQTGYAIYFVYYRFQ